MAAPTWASSARHSWIDEKGKIAHAWYKISPRTPLLKLQAALDEA